ncbi:MAG: type II toxin-antitoxin system PemK/MazF family toxin [Gammaproteobacteria bacterium]|nr:type II toxin-antitoxin system PemK/MazF family toxin [Gammaproteobacteria bacterium]
MKRGEIYFANLNPTIGSEINKTRPVLIVSNEANNRVASTITIVPITSNTKKVYPFEVLLKQNDSKLTKCSKAQCHQIRTISKQRITTLKAGNINQGTMIQIENALKLHLVL